MPARADAEGWLRLTLIPGVGDESLRQLLRAHGGPREILEAPVGALRKIVPAPLATAIAEGASNERVESALTWLTAADNHLVTLGDAEYPPRLLDAPDPPTVLYVKGRTDLLTRPALAVVGSRNATPQGLATARSFARALSDAGVAVVSGLALGIDGAAHEGALDGTASTIAVVGTGLDIVYPARHRELAHRIAAQGAIVSEFPLGMPALAANFPRRNRIISGIGLGCLVIEAALASGSLITARLANEQGKDVFAIPGSIHSPLSKGCHALIKQGAKLVDNVQDILDELKIESVSRAVERAGDQGKEHPLLAAMGYDPCSIDMLVERSGIGAAEVATLLTRFELEGCIAALPGGRFQRTR